MNARPLIAAACIGLALSVIMAVPAEAARKKFSYKRIVQSKSACDRFGWPLTREKEWFAKTDNPEIESGARKPAPPERAFVLSLESDADASYAMPPERKSHSDNGFGGAISFETVPRAGLYQITLSQDGLVDIIQNGQFLKKKASNMRRDCPGIRRAMRVELTAAPLVLQFGGVEMPSMTVAIVPAD